MAISPQKRSRSAALFILGASAFALAACQEEKTEAAAFPDKASCLAQASPGGWFTAADCDAAFAEAQALHEETAPRYDSQEVCEAEHGVGACGADSVSGGGSGSIFMPLLVGYMMGQALGGGRVMSQPVVKTNGGGFSTPGGGTRIGNLNSGGQVAASAFQKSAVTKGQPPMTRAMVAQRGGFGSTGGTRTGG